MMFFRHNYASKNNFDRDELARWWSHQNICWRCGLWHADCFHHVCGRSSRHADSILNAAPLNNFDCHLPFHGEITKRRNRVIFLERTIAHLLGQGYELNDNDRGFIADHIEEYRNISGAGVHRDAERGVRVQKGSDKSQYENPLVGALQVGQGVEGRGLLQGQG